MLSHGHVPTLTAIARRHRVFGATVLLALTHHWFIELDAADLLP